MATLIPSRDPIYELDHMSRAANHVKLAVTMNDVITAINAICAKTDSGTLGTNNVAPIGIKTLAQRVTS
jgi:hypothetical protein